MKEINGRIYKRALYDLEKQMKERAEKIEALRTERDAAVSRAAELEGLILDAYGIISAFIDEHEAVVLNDIEGRSEDPDYNHPDLNGQAEFDMLVALMGKLKVAGGGA